MFPQAKDEVSINKVQQRFIPRNTQQRSQQATKAIAFPFFNLKLKIKQD